MWQVVLELQEHLSEERGRQWKWSRSRLVAVVVIATTYSLRWRGRHRLELTSLWRAVERRARVGPPVVAAVGWLGVHMFGIDLGSGGWVWCYGSRVGLQSMPA